MVTLSIDTAANICAVAVNDTASGRLLSAISHDIGRGHAEILISVIEEALDQTELGYQDIDKVVTTIGPGSFTGVRVGISTARAIGLALSVPVVGVSVLHACARHANVQDRQHKDERTISVLLDARRDEFYFQPYCNDKPLSEARVCRMEQLVEFHQGFKQTDIVLCGSGANQFLNYLSESNPAISFDISHHLATAPIEVVAEIGVAEENAKTRPEPLYLREADAKQQEGFAILRAKLPDTNMLS